MKLHKFLITALIFSGSILAFNSSNAAAYRVRTVPSSTDQKKKDCQKTTPAKQPASSAENFQKNGCQSQILQANLWIGNGGTPK